jgi:hypothetical protein
MYSSIKRLMKLWTTSRKFSFQNLEKPYELSESTKEEMGNVFRSVMSELSFAAADSLLQRLYSTDHLIIVRNQEGRIIGFSNIAFRKAGDLWVHHILATYVHPDWRAYGLMEISILKWILHQKMKNLSRNKSMYLTASAVNPVAFHAMAKRFEVWPDLIDERPAPNWARDVARESAEKYYPIQTGKLFQVEIPAEFVQMQNGEHLKSRDDDFNRKFFLYANPEQRKLLFFVGRVTTPRLLMSFLT